jgi:hypothetical protein
LTRTFNSSQPLREWIKRVTKGINFSSKRKALVGKRKPTRKRRTAGRFQSRGILRAVRGEHRCEASTAASTATAAAIVCAALVAHKKPRARQNRGDHRVASTRDLIDLTENRDIARFRRCKRGRCE